MYTLIWILPCEDDVYKRYDLIPDKQAGDVVISAAILSPAAGLVQLSGSRLLRTNHNADSEDIDLSGGPKGRVFEPWNCLRIDGSLAPDDTHEVVSNFYLNLPWNYKHFAHAVMDNVNSFSMLIYKIN